MRFFLHIFIRMKHNLFHSDKINVLPNNCSKKLVKVLKNSIKEFLFSKVAKHAPRNSFFIANSKNGYFNFSYSTEWIILGIAAYDAFFKCPLKKLYQQINPRICLNKTTSMTHTIHKSFFSRQETYFTFFSFSF